MQSKLYYFNRLTVRTDLQPNGEFTAIDAADHDLGWPVGWGSTSWAAIIDLVDQLVERRLCDAADASW